MKLSVVALLLSICIFASAALNDTEVYSAFARFKAKYGKTYSKNELKHRLRVFRDNLNFIKTHNDDDSKSHKVGVTQYADLTNKEYRAMLGAKMDMRAHTEGPQFSANDTSNSTIPAEFDWRIKNVVTPIKDQGQCGSCWSFSAIAALESCYALKYGPEKMVTLSEQNLIDCSTSEGTLGCKGGWVDRAYDYIKKNGGIDTDKFYPYTTSGPNTCLYNTTGSASPVATITSYQRIQTRNETALLHAAFKAPISVLIDADHKSFQHYKSGVYYEPTCSEYVLDHAVLVIGWGTENGTDFWLVKNSWDTWWGDNGFIKMARNKNNNCGIATTAILPSC